MPMDQFTTKRLSVRHWASVLADPTARLALEADLRTVLTDAVLRHLPPPLQLDGTADDLSDWVSARARESDVLQVTRADNAQLIGLLILARRPDDTDRQTIHIGYLLAEAAWGQGIASELLCGLIDAARGGAPLQLVGGVDITNPASARVLQKAGFTRNGALSTKDTDMFTFDIN